MELEIENTEVVSANEIQIEAPGSVEVVEGEKDYEVSIVKKEYTIIGDGIFIPSMYEDAPPWLKEFIETTLNVAVTNRDQSLIDRLQSMLSLLDYVPKNQYTEQINQIVSEDGIINSRIATLNSNFTDSINTTNATIAEINLTYASKNEAAAIASNIITASLSGSGQIGSTLIQLQEAYADLESTTAQSISALESVLEGEINGNAQAMQILRTYIGVNEAGTETGDGLLANVETLQNQLDGKVEIWYTLSTSDPKIMWADTATRAKHDGDMWYQTDTKKSYWYNSSANSWNLIEDEKAIQALENAATAQDTADGKITTYYQSSAPIAEGVGDIWIDSDDGNKMYRWNGSTWGSDLVGTMVASSQAITTLQTNLNSTNIAVGGHTSQLSTVNTRISNGMASVETKWAYNSIVNINGVYKKSGFGLSSNYTSGNGTISNPYVSEFWIDASKLKFTNSSITGSVSPFTIDASGSIPKVTFNGTLNVRSAVNGVGGVTPTGYSSLGYFDTSRDQNAIGAVNRTSGGYAVSGIGTNTSSSVGVHGRGVYGVLGETTNGNGYWGLITHQKCYSGQGFSSPVTTISFTGGHTCFANTPIRTGDILEVLSGYLMTIDQSYTIVTTATTEKSKRVFGVASKVSDDVEANLRDYAEIHEAGDDISTLGDYKEEYKPFIDNLINNNYKDVTSNSIGEGGINVCSINGDIENGEYITSSVVAGKGMKQDDDLLHNYTVAKALEDVIWADETVGENGCFEFEGMKCKMIACTYHCG